MTVTRICCTCKQELPIDCFSKDKNNKSGHSGNCKECHKAHAKKHYLGWKSRRKPQGLKLELLPLNMQHSKLNDVLIERLHQNC